MANRKTRWSIPKIWSDAVVFIIGGGPSLKGFDFTPIQKYRVIGVNQAFRLGDWVDVCWFGDCSFYTNNREDLREFAGLKITCCTRVPEHGWPDVKNVGRGKQLGLVMKPDQVGWNRNSGASAINVALHLGAKTIILLGFDMMPNNKEHNWHDRYGVRSKNHNPYPGHLKGFLPIAKDLAKWPGTKVINANPDSIIDVFPKMTFEEVMEKIK